MAKGTRLSAESLGRHPASDKATVGNGFSRVPVAVQQKMMRHTDIRTTMNIYGDVVTDEMATAGMKVAQLAFREN